MSWFRLKYGPSGKLLSCDPIDKPEAYATVIGLATFIEIEATDEKDAKHRAYNFYCARKKKLAKERNYTAGLCACSRKQDRPNTKTGKGFFNTCSVCAERSAESSLRHLAKKKQGLPLDGRRDEAARVESFQVRNRDRKNEIRLETLIEVRKQWENSRTNGQFTSWLKSQIDESLEPRVGV